jgi:prepilin-type N-terminal cleavage/methylation domain-containing protein
MRCTVAAWSADAGRGRDAPAGFSLAELLVALALSGFLGAIVFGVLHAQLRLARVTAERAIRNEAVRTTLAVIGGEARRTVPADVRDLTADSLALRSFRGLGVPCAVGADTVLVRYRGDRLPDSTKDSVLMIAPDGSRGLQLLDARYGDGASCPVLPGETVLRLRVSDAFPEAAVLLIFESGRYFLAGRALRYRLGGEGRQPITTEAFAHPATRFGLAAGPRLTFILAPHGFPPVLHSVGFAPPPHR